MPSVYEKYRLKPVINASGRMTILGVSTPEQDVVDAVNFGLGHYFEVKDLVNKTGAYLAELLGVEDAVVVSCASAGIAQSVAAVIVRGDPYRLEQLHAHAHDVPSDIVLPKGHNVNFGAPVGTMVNLGGGKVVEAGYANECSAAQLAAAINASTAAILYIKSHHCVQKSILSVAEAAEVAKAHGIPLIVDAAAEEDLRLYYNQGAALVIYSGAKAIEGPTSGLVLGRRQYVEWVKQQAGGIGRAMKVGKEGILGLTHAIERYLAKEKESGTAMVAKMTPFIERLNQLPGVSAKVVWDSAGRDIARTDIAFDHQQIGMTTVEVVSRLQQGTPAIYCRGYKANEGHIEIDVRSVTLPQLDQIHSVIAHLVQENN
ncbi:DgaE family pyridoxal phosphate-dependent ammonia lyase [Aeromonas caviae]|uniref:DgaE family pyridoxal phosphate-dependent ammonia lyase n=1 Tax=Aeromonas caviae TaxID=648 RepID=UPI000DD92D14|nr:DgaE family pyridoxal phosphate-dependent ammonia lyase [Aeromonas caviae]AXB00986.1 DgaE family pyridoxal phosphate-dependent ammonia lyase [Aeromonas caviae]QLL79201.1 DgaE family pyridoxal phosphate-dependent ammonia lyase [Aeromonas caviae]UBS65829.1 DgaE family pyridoxal phosphate-dependent ammonia lyase [Aeromonas caviae]WKS85295.1 DgaE family pyridoxal phosphate-dependent ammonia lyase [Aeromonas caviae]BDC85022.1 L-seryl-tRNA selenium transferase [Aeromonas caviae]